MTRFATVFLAALLTLSLTACGGTQKEQSASRQIIAMDTAMSFQLYGENGDAAITAMVEEVQRLESVLSRTDSASQVGVLNRSPEEQVEVGAEVCALIEQARGFTQATGGAFDITVAPVVEAWGFTADAYRVPPQEELDGLLAAVGMEHVRTDGAAAWLDAGTQIDLGGIAKGYASDRLTEIFKASGAERGWASLGGNVAAWGAKPNGEPWRVGVRDPKFTEQEALVGMIGLKDAYAVTSGGYERFFEENGRIYHHILDPETGHPAESGLVSVTVVADCATEGSGAMCDALSTALFVMGEEAALEFRKNSGLEFDLVLVTADDRVVVTDGIAEAFSETEGSGYTYETVS